MIVIRLKKIHLILLLVFIFLGIYLSYITCKNKIRYKIDAAEILKDTQQYYMFKRTPIKRQEEILKIITSGNIRVLSSYKNKSIKQEMNMQRYCLLITLVDAYKKDFNKSIVQKIDNLCKDYQQL